jgi:hypothetical protein
MPSSTPPRCLRTTPALLGALPASLPIALLLVAVTALATPPAAADSRGPGGRCDAYTLSAWDAAHELWHTAPAPDADDVGCTAAPSPAPRSDPNPTTSPAGTTPPPAATPGRVGPSGIAAPPGPPSPVVVTAPFDPTTAPPGIYVDCATGDDTGPGTAMRPWRTLTGLTHPIAAGTAVYLRRTCQWDGVLTLTTSGAVAASTTGPTTAGTAGTSTAPSTDTATILAAYGPGIAPTLTATGADRSRSILEINAPNVTVAGIHLAHAAGYAVTITGPNALLDGVEVDDVGIGIRIQAPFATVTGGVIHDLHMYNNTPGGDDDATIAFTSCTHCRVPSYDYGFDGGFVDVWRHGNRLQLVGNTGSDIQGFLEIGGLGGTDSAFDVIATGNVITDTHTGVWVHGDGTFAIATANITLDGNTFTTTDSEPLLGGAVSSLVLRNNTFTTPSGTTAGP